MFKLKSKRIFAIGAVAVGYGTNLVLKKKGFDVFEQDMKLIFPNLSKSNRWVEINNYYQLESLVNSAYTNNVQMKLKKIHDTHSRQTDDSSRSLNLPTSLEDEAVSGIPLVDVRGKPVEIDINGLSAIKNIYPEDRLVVVEGGIRINDLNSKLKEYGLMFPTPLFQDETIMEVINENFLLADSYKNGSVRNHIEDIILMTPSSKLVKTGNLTGDDFWYGYHIKDLIIGSHYSLGFITEWVLKLHELQQHGLLVTVQLDSDSTTDYMQVLKHIRDFDGHGNFISSIRLYNSDTYKLPESIKSKSKKKLLVFYCYSNTKEKQSKILSELKQILKQEIVYESALPP